MDVKIEKTQGIIIATLPEEAVKPDAMLRANILEILSARDIKALLVDMIGIPEMTDELASLIMVIQHQAGLRDLKVYYFNLSGNVQDYLELSGLSSVLQICRSRFEAFRICL